MSEKNLIKPLLPTMPRAQSDRIVSQEEATKQYEFLREAERIRMTEDLPNILDKIQRYYASGNKTQAKHLERKLRDYGITPG